MISLLTPYITLFCTSGVLNLYLCFYVYLRRQNYKRIAQFFIVYTASIAIYCFGSAFGLVSTSLGQIKFWTSILYIGMPISSPLGLLFIMQYLGVKTTKTRVIGLLIIPMISLVMVATNDVHHLHYKVFEVDPTLGVPYIYQEIGLWYVVHGMFTFACMFVAFFLVLSRWRETAKVYRPQLISLAFGQLIPMVTAFLYLIGLTPPGIDPVPMVLWLTSLFYLWSISSSRLFTIMPIAKDAIFNSINDGVMVVDESHTLIEFNQASKRMFPILSKSMYGKKFGEVWYELSGEVFPISLDGEEVTQELQITSGDSERIYQVRATPLEHVNDYKGFLIILTDITNLKKLQVKLEHQAYYDELTKIYNRRAFFQQCEEYFAESKETSSPFTVILMDIDHFKKVNDTYGHNIGDQLLVHVVKVCQQQLEEGELFARYGGEEFVLALKGCTALEGQVVANQIRTSLETQPFTSGSKVLSVTLSFEVAEIKKGTEETLYQLLNKADKALYASKRKGRNQVQIYTGQKEI